MMEVHRVLIIENDLAFGNLLAKELERKDLLVEQRADAVKIDEHIQRFKPELLAIDLSMPTQNEVLKSIRSKFRDLPILVLSASSRPEDLEQAFEFGADDYLTKPVSLRELVARSRRLLMRHCTVTSSLRRSSIVINRECLAVFRGGKQIDLTPKEFAILDLLAKNSGKIVTRQSLMEEIWHASAEAGTNVVDVYMKYLRDKLEKGHDHKMFRTVRGVGYVLKSGECQYA